VVTAAFEITMNLFCKKEDSPREILVELPPVKTGERFKYLGVEMLCVRDWIFGGLEYPSKRRGIVAQYRNEQGEICEQTFYPCDYAALKAEFGRSEEVGKLVVEPLPSEKEICTKFIERVRLRYIYDTPATGQGASNAYSDAVKKELEAFDED